jgi:RND family efflux transporter MFP subunit
MRRLLCLLVLLTSCTDESVLAPTAAPVAAPARPATVAAPLVGVIAAKNSDVVAAQIDGRVVNVIATTGQRVHAGDAIAELDASVLTERLQVATAAVEAAHADLAGAGAEGSEAQRQLALEQRMFQAGAAAEESVRIARATVARASASGARAMATLREAEANHAVLAAQLARTHLVAPFDGVVSLVKAQPGEVVLPGTVIARVFDPRQLAIRFQVTHDRRHDVAPGTRVTLRVAGVDGVVEALVTTVSADLEPPLDFAVAEADVIGVPTDAQVGAVGDVQVISSL